MRRVCAALALLAACWAACGPPPPAEKLPYSQPIELRGVDLAPLRGRRILLDPGHGGRFAGAVGDRGGREADINLGVALALWGLLRDAGAEVHLTRASDRDLLPPGVNSQRADLDARVHAVDSLRPEVFLSLHHNSNAARDRERNAIETYFKLDAAGPSLDLGRAITARLARHLGIQPASVVPSNFYVLRGSAAAAVLGEASYLSNPRVESQLALAASQRREAEAYFLGLVDYFACGAASIERRVPESDTLAAGARMRFTIAAAIDPLSAEVLVDGAPLAATVEAAGKEIVTSAFMSPGPHTVEARARLASGNAATPWRGAVWVQSPPARVIVTVDPTPANTSDLVRLVVAVQDSAGRAVGSGVPVRLAGSDVEVVAAESVTTHGTVHALVRVGAASAAVGIEAGGLRHEFPLRMHRPEARAGGYIRCLDTVDGRAVPHAWLGGGLAESDRAGFLHVPAGTDSLQVTARGYLPWRGIVPADAILRLQPLYGGLLAGVGVMLDPASGDANFPAGESLANPGTAFAICRALAALLTAAGGRAILTREPLEAPSDLQRLQRTLVAAPAFYLSVEITSGGGAVLHDPASAAGERLANSLATWLRRRLGGADAVRAATRFMLRQTPCPAVIVQIPAPAVRDPKAVQAAAYAAFLGVRGGIDPSLPAGAIGGEVRPPEAAALAELDGAAVLPLDDAGRFRFEAVEPGTHRLRLLGGRPTEMDVEMDAAAESVWVRFEPPPSPRAGK